MGQIPVIATNAPVALFTLPPGLCNVIFWNAATATCYVGTSTALTTTNSLVCHSIPTQVSSYVSSGPATFYGSVPTSGTALINFVLATDQK
jgi:hypothetical protein